MSDVSLTISSINVTRAGETGSSGTGTVPSSNTPTGPAGGDLAGTFPSPSLASDINTTVRFQNVSLQGNSTYQGQDIADDYIASATAWNTAKDWVDAFNIASYVDKAYVEALGISYASLSDKPTLAAVATSGAWSDLTGTPTTLAGYGVTSINADNIDSGTLPDERLSSNVFSEVTLDLSSDPNFTTGSVKLRKVFGIVTIQEISAITFPSSSDISTAANFIPVGYRTISAVSNTYMTGRRVLLNTDHTIRFLFDSPLTSGAQVSITYQTA